MDGSSFVVALWAQLPGLLGVLLYRCLPFAGYIAVSRRVGPWQKHCSLSCYILVAWLFVRWDASNVGLMLVLTQGTVYFVATALLWHTASQGLPLERVGRATLAVLSALLFVAGPAFLFGKPGIVLQIAGWEIAMSAYSYAIEARSARRFPSLRDSLFFLLVDPVLVYAERGELVSSPSLSTRLLGRCGLGMLALLARRALAIALFSLPWLAAPSGAPTVQSVPQFLLHYGLCFVAGYASHSGVASLQLAFMRMLGYRVPERYRYPLVAGSPADFWRRWNTYVGSFFRRHLFYPLAKRLLRLGAGRRRIALACAALVTFLGCGLYHDYSFVLQQQRASLASTHLFLLHGLAYMAWLGAGRTLGAWQARFVESTAAWRLLGGSVSRLCFLPLLALTAWLAIPALEQGALPEPLQEFWRGRLDDGALWMS